MLCQVFTAVGELFTVQPYPHKECTEGEFFIVGDRFLRADAPCGQCVLIQRKGKGNVAANLSCMGGAVESSQLDGVMPVEKTM